VTSAQVAHRQAQAVRWVRIVAVALLAQPVVAALVSSTLVRYPLVAAVVAAAEVAVRQVYRVKPLSPRISPAPSAPAVPPSPGSS
jgi:hypothetical protein